MKLLVLGYSSIARRRVLPAARAASCVTQVEVASRTLAQARPPELAGVRAWSDYGEALERSDCDVVYVSLVNALHAAWVDRALSTGRDVIVDKPAFLGLREAEAALERAVAQGRLLAEATVWPFHPQVAELQRALADGPLRAITLFSFPPLPPDNYRWQAALGGGALWDLGPYAVSAGRVLFGGEPATIGGRVLSRGQEVDTGFSFWADYGDGRAIAGHMGYDTAYANSLEVVSRAVRVGVERIFTTPVELANTLAVRRADAPAPLRAPAADSFACFFEAVAEARRRRAHAPLRDALWSDARALDRLRRAALG